jgi:hypothetical protein
MRRRPEPVLVPAVGICVPPYSRGQAFGPKRPLSGGNCHYREGEQADAQRRSTNCYQQQLRRFGHPTDTDRTNP